MQSCNSLQKFCRNGGCVRKMYCWKLFFYIKNGGEDGKDEIDGSQLYGMGIKERCKEGSEVR